MKSFFVVIVFTLLGSHSFGQSKRLVTHTLLGISVPGTKNLESALQSADLLKTSSIYFSRGAGLYVTFPKARLATMAFFSSYAGTKEEGQKSTTTRGTQIGSSLGFLLMREKAWQVIPFAGVAYSFFGVRTTKVSPAENFMFTDYIAGSANQYNITSNQWMGNIGLQVTKEGIGSGLLKKLVLGIRAGQYLPFADSKWKTNETKLSGGPDVNSGGFYAGLLIGFVQ